MSTEAGSKEAELVTAVFLYAIRALAEGDQHALSAMNFGPKEISALRALNLADLYRAASLKAHCLDIRLNRAVYWPLIAHLRRARESEIASRRISRSTSPGSDDRDRRRPSSISARSVPVLGVSWGRPSRRGS